MCVGWEEGLECEVCAEGIHLKHVSEFRYSVLEKSGTDGIYCSRKVASGRRVAGTIKSLVCSLSVLRFCMNYCWCLFLRMVVRQ